jgi:hypothetical protein
MRARAIICAILATATAMFIVASVRADDPNVLPTPSAEAMLIIVKADALSLPINQRWRPDVRTLGQDVLSLTAYADGQRCTSVPLTGTSGEVTQAGDRVIRILATAKSPACSREGSGITLVDAKGRELAVEFKNQPGSIAILDNLAPKAPHTGTSANVAHSGSSIRVPLFIVGIGLILVAFGLSLNQGKRHASV